MTDKLKKIIAVGGASLMAGTAAVPTHAASGTQAGANSTQTKAGNNIINHIKEHPVHSTATAAFALTTIGSILLNITQALRGGKQSDLPILKDEIRQVLAQVPNNGDLAVFLGLNLTHEDSLQMVKLTSYKDSSGYTEGQGTKAENSFVKIEAGEASGGLCKNGSLLEHLTGKTVSVEKVAVYMACAAGGEHKLTVVSEQRNNTDLFQTAEKDPTLNSYDRNNLTKEGKTIADIIITKLLASQENYAKKQSM